MNRYLLIIIITINLGIDTYATSLQELNNKFINYFLIGDIPAWTKTVDSLRQLNLDTNTQIQLLYGEYGLIGNLIGSGNEGEAREHLLLFEERVEKTLLQQPNNGDVRAFAAATVAYRIALQPWRAPFLSRAHSDNVRTALEKTKGYGLPLVEHGNSLYFRPSFVGGNKSKAIEVYEQAYAFFKENQRDHWMYYNVAAWLGQAYANQGMTEKAEAIYLQLLDEAPEFTWVRDELLPQLREGKPKSFWNFQ